MLMEQTETHSMLSRSGGLCREPPECDGSQVADSGVGPLTYDSDNGEGKGDFTGGFWGGISCFSVRGDNRTKVFMSKSQ